MESRTRLPDFLRPLFWDVAFHTLSPERHRERTKLDRQRLPSPPFSIRLKSATTALRALGVS